MKELLPPPTHRETFRVRYRETDRNGILKLSSWFDFLQEAAANHATRLGVGLEALSERELLWVLSRLHLAIRRYPEIGETVTVETWPNGFRRLFAHRQFRLTGEDGKELAVASSAWLLLSAEKLRPVRLEQLPAALPPNAEKPDYFPLETKLPEPEVPARFQIRVRPTMEDVNGHLNNAEYAGLVQDCATGPGESSPRFREVELHFLSAVRAPELLTVGGIRSGSSFLCCGRNEAGQLSFNAAAELQ